MGKREKERKKEKREIEERERVRREREIYFIFFCIVKPEVKESYPLRSHIFKLFKSLHGI